MSGTNIINSLPVPINFTAAGAVQRSPDDIRNDLIALVASTNPGYTILPAGLIEDLSSTAVGALMMIDQAFVAFINSIGPGTANAYLLAQLGLVIGVTQGGVSNTSVPVRFSGTPGFPVGVGFLVSDGGHQYALAEGAIVGGSGTSNLVTAIATEAGSWAVPPETVTTLVTGIPASVSLSVINPTAGIPSFGPESLPQFRARVLEGTQAIATGVTTTVKSALKALSGVVPRLVSMRLRSGVGWEIICGGGDIYQIALAIFLSIGDGLPTLVGSATPERNAVAAIYDYPDTYPITFVIPPLQVVTMTVLWNTNDLQFTAGFFVNIAAIPFLIEYINDIEVGQPINIFELEQAFFKSLTGIIKPELVSRLVFEISINGVGAAPLTGTGVIPGDPESYFEVQSSGIVVNQG